ncbi:Gfo/Idh/MocA family protein [Olivibacter domesticus]|uniref:Predicted dehydrogenase n=1 Tax=Olivibacter domesticus TaxID=407022 RepID=A0A1H7TAE3_OLID1|nr:Gfo/Idh/MocA family oxidoreductase [Olivibacter domesticus]SEL81364.1 Predicted dehydrogenase [Olivibacter domesticus]
MKTKTINWGMIGAGDVTEVKSGPAFQKVKDSRLVAVMRRDEEKVRDYALRHGIQKWFTDAQKLIEDPEINAIYIATPPDTHDTYAIAALEAGKDVYVEKPMVLSVERAKKLVAAVHNNKNKLSVAHYRREQPYFKKIKTLLEENTIGKPQMVLLQLANKPLTGTALQDPKIKWRLDPGQSGGGLFHDLAPHQVDLMYYFFGAIKEVCGISHNQTGLYQADDVVAGQILFQNDLLFNGTWNFNAFEEIDNCQILGSEGKLSFSIFNKQPIELINQDGTASFSFEPLTHVQQPMIEAVVAYFKGEGSNPCSVEEGLEVMKVLDTLTGKQ